MRGQIRRMEAFLQQLINGVTLGAICEPSVVGYLPLSQRSALMRT